MALEPAILLLQLMIITAECCSLVIILFLQVERYTKLALIASVREIVQNSPT